MLSVTVKAQVTFPESAIVNNNQVGANVVRSWSPKGVVTCSDHQFVLTTGNSDVYTIDLNTNMFVEDFRILGDTVFFCGHLRNGTVTTGLVGYFDLYQFYLNGDFSYGTINDFVSLRKMVVYRDLLYGTYNVVCVGHYRNTATHSAILACVYNMAAGQVSFAYNYGASQITASYYSEDFVDIALTDNYVVITGHNTNITSTWHDISLYRFNRSTIYSDLLTANSLQRYDYNIHSMDEPMTTFIIESTAGDSVVVASLGCPKISEYEFSMRLRTFDMTTMVMTHAQELALPNKTWPTDMEYIPYDHSVLILMDDVPFTPQDTYDVVAHFNPYATSTYVADMLYIPDYIFRALGCLDGSVGIVGGYSTQYTFEEFPPTTDPIFEKNNLSLHTLLFKNMTKPFVNGCYKHGGLKSLPVTTIDYMQNSTGVNKDNDISLLNISSGRNIDVSTIRCMH